jgi:hypothetical protein
VELTAPHHNKPISYQFTQGVGLGRILWIDRGEGKCLSDLEHGNLEGRFTKNNSGRIRNIYFAPIYEVSCDNVGNEPGDNFGEWARGNNSSP